MPEIPSQREQLRFGSDARKPFTEIRAEPLGRGAQQRAPRRSVQRDQTVRILVLERTFAHGGMEEQRISFHPRVKTPQLTHALSVCEEVFRIDEHPPSVPKGGVHVDGKEQAAAEVGGRHVERIVLDPVMNTEEEESSFADDPANDAIDASRILGMDDDVDIVPNPIGEILLVTKDEPPGPFVVERTE